MPNRNKNLCDCKNVVLTILWLIQQNKHEVTHEKPYIWHGIGGKLILNLGGGTGLKGVAGEKSQGSHS